MSLVVVGLQLDYPAEAERHRLPWFDGYRRDLSDSLVFIAAGRDPTLRAFDIDTGHVLWSGTLPAAAQATPMTYRTASGKQFVVIAAGGHSALRSQMGDSVMAFSLP